MPNNIKNIVLIILFIILICLAFIIGRQSKKDPVIIPQPDISGFVRAIDSLTILSKKRKDSIEIEHKRFDSLSSSIKNNHKNVNNEKVKIKNFTPDDRIRWNDSVLRANGLK